MLSEKSKLPKDLCAVRFHLQKDQSPAKLKSVLRFRIVVAKLLVMFDTVQSVFIIISL
jgi:hypothetical protein